MIRPVTGTQVTMRPMTWRRAIDADARALRDLERAAFTTALPHVFDPAVHAYPDDAVLARWSAELREPDVVTEVLLGAGDDELLAYVCTDLTHVRHVAVVPTQWRGGLGTEALSRAVARIPAAAPRLWVLERNEPARRLYSRLGWSPNAVTRRCEFPPYPVEMEYVLERSGR